MPGVGPACLPHVGFVGFVNVELRASSRPDQLKRGRVPAAEAAARSGYTPASLLSAGSCLAVAGIVLSSVGLAA